MTNSHDTKFSKSKYQIFYKFRFVKFDQTRYPGKICYTPIILRQKTTISRQKYENVFDENLIYFE